MKRLILITLTIASLSFAKVTYAVLPKTVQQRTNATIELRKNASPPGEMVKQNNQERLNIVNQLKEKIKETIARRYHGILKTVSGSTLTVSTEKGDMTVHITDATILKRRFGANSTITEFAVGDELAIVGKRSGSSETEVEAKYIRNLSIQRRNTVFSGNIVSMNTGDGSFVVKTLNRGEQTTYISSQTVITEKNKTILFTDLKVGDKVIVKGELWDRASAKIDAKKIMRLSLRATPSSSDASTNP